MKAFLIILCMIVATTSYGRMIPRRDYNSQVAYNKLQSMANPLDWTNTAECLKITQADTNKVDWVKLTVIEELVDRGDTNTAFIVAGTNTYLREVYYELIGDNAKAIEVSSDKRTDAHQIRRYFRYSPDDSRTRLLKVIEFLETSPCRPKDKDYRELVVRYILDDNYIGNNDDIYDRWRVRREALANGTPPVLNDLEATKFWATQILIYKTN